MGVRLMMMMRAEQQESETKEDEQEDKEKDTINDSSIASFTCDSVLSKGSWAFSVE